MSGNIVKTKDYKEFIRDIKQRIQTVQIKAAVAVNRKLLRLYWDLAERLVEKQKQSAWGDSFIQQMSIDLQEEFPEMKGFSERNIKYMRQWFLFYNPKMTIGQQAVAQLEKTISRQVVGQLTQIPWGHNIAIISKCKNLEEALYYVQNTITYNWSRSVLVHQMESDLYEREGKSVTNFASTLPKPQSDLAVQILKDPYIFDFLTLTKDLNELELEKELIQHITHFLLELGAGFAYIGRQLPLKVGDREFFIDLLFYHTRLHCYVVIELKTTNFEPEHAGKLNFYIKAVDCQYRQEGDQPTIGILLCKSKDQLVAEYALSDIHKPIGVSEYQLTHTLPDNLKPSLPSIEDLEKELAEMGVRHD
ncbi:PDDEXK nuclease domain-containing protein [Deltaproteobacteria bacterium TL4]